MVDRADQRREHDDQRASAPVSQAADPAREDEERDQLDEEQRLDERGDGDEALEPDAQIGRGEDRARECRGVHAEQDARDDAEVPEIGQDVGVHVLPYTHHGYEGLFNNILHGIVRAWRESRNPGRAASRKASMSG